MSYISARVDRKRDVVMVWERPVEGQPRILQTYDAPYYFYVSDDDGNHKTIFDRPGFPSRVSKLNFKTGREYYTTRKQIAEAGDITMWESDITPELRILSKKYYKTEPPQPHITMLDIEVDYDPDIGFSSTKNPYAPINAISLFHKHQNRMVVIAVPPPTLSDADITSAALKRLCDEILPIPEKYTTDVYVCETENELLTHIIREIQDSDILCGWNSATFDFPYIAKRMEMVLGKHSLRHLSFPGGDPAIFEEIETEYGPATVLRTSGRIVADYMELFKKYEAGERPSYKLEAISDETLVDPKTGEPSLPKMDYDGTLADLYMGTWQPKLKALPNGQWDKLTGYSVYRAMLTAELQERGSVPPIEPNKWLEQFDLDFSTKTNEQLRAILADVDVKTRLLSFGKFVRYNIRDCEILDGFEQTLGFVILAVHMYHSSGGLFHHVLGTLKLAELAIVNYCHHERRRVVKNITEPKIDRSIDGAFVLYPQVGMHEWIGSIDINSLYPSTIRSIGISIETLRGQFTGCKADAMAVALGDNSKVLTLVLETGEQYNMTGLQFRTFLQERNWSISGYGTVFDQTQQGIIPAILSVWYSQRKQYQALKKQALDAKDTAKAEYYDRLQYVFKIKLNSLYGALTNQYFRFYDLRMGESTTASGRMILLHQCRKVNEVMTGEYNVDIPMYATVEDAADRGYPADVALNGPKFKGTFQATSVLYGDTDSTYFRTLATDKEQAIAIADRVAELVNDSYPEFMRQTFLCNPGYDDIIKCGREVVSDRGIFVGKKLYILHLVDLDGKRVDKMKTMGLSIKKTTIPRHVSDKLESFVTDILKGESWEYVSQEIVDYKTTLIQCKNVMDIGLPKGVSGVEAYTKEYEMYGDKARLPGHVAASIYYNLLLKQYNDKNSTPIISGTKIKVFYVKNKHSKFKSVAIPTDAGIAPEWFLANFDIDYDAHVERLVDKPLQTILNAIGKPVPTPMTMMMDDLFVF